MDFHPITKNRIDEIIKDAQLIKCIKKASTSSKSLVALFFVVVEVRELNGSDILSPFVVLC